MANMLPMIKFVILLILQIFAILISILIFVYVLSDRHVRSEPKHRIWFVLLTVNFAYLATNLPMVMSHLYRGRAMIETAGFCVWWSWYELSLNALGLHLMAWASVERHLFIFHSHTLMRVRWTRWLLHNAVIVFIFTWTVTFHFVLIVLHPTCTDKWQFDQNLCGWPCFLLTANRLYGLIAFIGNTVLPLTIISVANVSLVIRVIYQKISHHQVVHWNRHYKLTFQLWIISSVYLACWLPFTVSQIVRWTIMPTFFLGQVDTLLFMIYFIPLLLPLACLNSYPELVAKMHETIRRALRRNRVGIPTPRPLH